MQYRWFLAGGGLAIWILILGYFIVGALCRSFLLFISGPVIILWGMALHFSLAKVGFTALAGFIWKRLGRDAETAIAVGIGAMILDLILNSLYLTCFCIEFISFKEYISNAPGYSSWNELLLSPIFQLCSMSVYTAACAAVLLGISRKRFRQIIWWFVGIFIYEAFTMIFQQARPTKPELTFWQLIISGIFAGISIKIIINIYKQWNSKKLEADSVMEDVAEEAIPQ